MMNGKRNTTVVFSVDCVERCGVIPDLRSNQQGTIEAFIPQEGADSMTGEWVPATVTEHEGIVTITCDATADGFQAVYQTTVQRFEEAWHRERRHRERVAGVPRHCGPCKDRMGNIPFTTRNTEEGFFIDTPDQLYQFNHDEQYGVEFITPEMVSIVVNYMKSHEQHGAVDASFFEILRRVFEGTARPGPEKQEKV